MPELPEVEITARRLGTRLCGSRVESALARGVVAVKSYDPPLEALQGARLEAVGRRGKMLLLYFDELAVIVHLMQAGRLQLFEKRGSIRDRTLRVAFRFEGGLELRLREFGTQQRAWVKLVSRQAMEGDPALSELGPEAWPAPDAQWFASLCSKPRHLHPLLRDQRAIAGIGRAWCDEILWETCLSPFRRADQLDAESVERLRTACAAVCERAIDHYERTVGEVIPDKLPMPLRVHGRQKSPCPRCATTLEAVFFKEHVTTYCPAEQTGGQILKDRRLSRLLL